MLFRVCVSACCVDVCVRLCLFMFYVINVVRYNFVSFFKKHDVMFDLSIFFLFLLISKPNVMCVEYIRFILFIRDQAHEGL